MIAEGYWSKHLSTMIALNEIVSDDSYEDNKVFVLPTYFVNPAADAAGVMEINEPYLDFDEGNKTYIAKGQHPDVHVGGKAHAAYAYQRYSWIKWTIANGLVL